MTDTKIQNGNFGIRVSLPAGDPFTNLLDADWQTTHWFTSRNIRDTSLVDMCREHEYSRKGDAPALVFEPVERDNPES